MTKLDAFSGVCRQPQQAEADPGDLAQESRQADWLLIQVSQRPVGGRAVQWWESILDKTDQRAAATGIEWCWLN